MTAAKIIGLNGKQVNADPLDEQINIEHEAVLNSLSSAVRHAMKCGDLMNQKKVSLPHGQWVPWVERHFKGSRSTAERYMRLHSNASFVTHLLEEQPDIGLTEVYKALPKPERKPRSKPTEKAEPERKPRSKKSDKENTPRYSWSDVAVDEGVLSSAKSGGSTQKLREQIFELSPDLAGNINKPETEGRLREVLTQIRRNKEGPSEEIVTKANEEAETAGTELSATATQKLERAKRVAEKAIRLQLEREILTRVNGEMEEERKKLRQMANKIADERIAMRKLQSRKLPLTREEFRIIRSCLHPDREADTTRVQKAFQAFNKLAVFFND